MHEIRTAEIVGKSSSCTPIYTDWAKQGFSNSVCSEIPYTGCGYVYTRPCDEATVGDTSFFMNVRSVRPYLFPEKPIGPGILSPHLHKRASWNKGLPNNFGRSLYLDRDMNQLMHGMVLYWAVPYRAGTCGAVCYVSDQYAVCTMYR